MHALPVIVRELRAEARHPFTYGLRLIGAAALMLGAAFVLDVAASASQQGASLFACMHGVLLAAIWIFVPVVTADCISRERREGTLGLLFLTPLTAWDIVVAKSLAHGLRAATLCLAVLPVLVLPVLMGGVNAQLGLLSVAILAGSFALSLSAGLLASSWSKQWHRGLIVAFLLAGALCVLLAMAQGWQLLDWWNAQFKTGRLPRPDRGLGGTLAVGFLTLVMPARAATVASFAPVPAAAQQAFLVRCCGIMGCCFLFLPLALWLAARNVRGHWQERPPSVFGLWCQRTFCSIILGRSELKRWMSWYLERNPVGWLELRRWSGRLVGWGWLAVLVSILGMALSSERTYLQNDFQFLLHSMAVILIASVGFTAAGSFRRERETRVLELLLVTPLSLGQIIWGRLRGLLAQFLPAAILLGAVWLYLKSIFGPNENLGAWPWYYGTSFLTVLFNGVYFSLRTRHHITAVLATLTCWLVPGAFENVMGVLAGLGLAPKRTAVTLVFGLALLSAVWGLQYAWAQRRACPAVFVMPVFTAVLLSLALWFDSLPFGWWGGHPRAGIPMFEPFLQLAVSGILGWRLFLQLQQRDFAALVVSR